MAGDVLSRKDMDRCGRSLGKPSGWLSPVAARERPRGKATLAASRRRHDACGGTPGGTRWLNLDFLQRIEKAAAASAGLLGVHNQLRIRPPEPAPPPANVADPCLGVPLVRDAGQVNHKV